MHGLKMMDANILKIDLPHSGMDFDIYSTEALKYTECITLKTFKNFTVFKILGIDSKFQMTNIPMHLFDNHKMLNRFFQINGVRN